MQEKYEEAETIHRQTLVARERVLGKDHPNKLWSAYELGYKLSRQYIEKGMSSLPMKIFRLFSSLLRFVSLSKMLTLLHLSSRVAAEGFKHPLGERDEDQVLGRYFDVREYLQVCPPPSFSHPTSNLLTSKVLHYTHFSVPLGLARNCPIE
jgi:hypothetical protein